MSNKLSYFVLFFALMLSACSAFQKQSVKIQESDILGCYTGSSSLKNDETDESSENLIGFEFNEDGVCTVSGVGINVAPFDVKWYLKNSHTLVVENSPYKYLNQHYRISKLNFSKVLGQQVLTSFTLEKGKRVITTNRIFNPDSTIQREYFDLLYIDESILNLLKEKKELDIMQSCSILYQLISPVYYNCPEPLSYYVADYLYQNPTANEQIEKYIVIQNEGVQNRIYLELYKGVINKYGSAYENRNVLLADFLVFRKYTNIPSAQEVLNK